MSRSGRRIRWIPVVFIAFTLSGCRAPGVFSGEIPRPSPGTVSVSEPSQPGLKAGPENPETGLAEEARKGKARLEKEYPYREIIWFQITGPDSPGHLYFATRNMNFSSWLKSAYNRDRWHMEGEEIVSGDGSLVLNGADIGGKTVLEEGAKYTASFRKETVSGVDKPALSVTEETKRLKEGDENGNA